MRTRQNLFRILKLVQLSLEDCLDLLQVSCFLVKQFLELITIFNDFLDLAGVKLDCFVAGLFSRFQVIIAPKVGKIRSKSQSKSYLEHGAGKLNKENEPSRRRNRLQYLL